MVEKAGWCVLFQKDEVDTKKKKKTNRSGDALELWTNRFESLN